MSYSIFDDILGEISQDVLIQLTNDSYTVITADMIQLAISAGNLSALTPDEVLAANFAAATINKVLERSSAQVDGYCSNLYDVPFDTVTSFLRSLDLDIVIYNLFSRRENVPENRLTRYKNAVKCLEGIARGDIQLGATKTAAPQKGQTVAVSPAMEEIFTMDRLKNY
ncbi:MAG: DUF1320 domain-containing protein [Desulfobacteraceae bacterium]|nr:DUF1320 domain-containing protein [Desulfobacteraceae bacterium]